MRALMSVLGIILIAFATANACDDDTYDPATGPNTPIVINFANGPYELTGADAPVWFDIRATGKPVLMGWTAAGADAAFLCVDRDRNGTIDSGAELFGNAVTMSDGSRSRNGFMALADFDVNRDWVVDEHDARWEELQLWRDLNHDAVSQTNELSSVSGSGMTAISLDHQWTGRRDKHGNLYRYQSEVWIADASHRATPRPVYDISFVGVQN